MNVLDQIFKFLYTLTSFSQTTGEASMRVSSTQFTNIENSIEAVDETLSDGSQVTQIIPTESATTMTVSDTAVTEDGSVTTGALSIEFITSNDFVGTIGGVSIPYLAVKTYPYQPGYKYPAIAYTVTEGTLYISRRGE